MTDVGKIGKSGDAPTDRTAPPSRQSHRTGPRLLLVGGGHAHLFVLEGIAGGRLPRANVTMVTPSRRHLYSGMLPGLVGGRYTVDEISFDLGAIADRSGVELVEGSVAAVDRERREVVLADGRRLGWDLVSFAVGSAPAGLDHPEAGDRVLPVRPIDRGLELIPALERVASERGDRALVVVAGGGAAAVELALAARRRLGRSGAAGARVVLVGEAPRLLPGRGAAVDRLARRALARGRVEVRLGERWPDPDPETAREADLIIWATGGRGPALFAGARLALDERGYLLVDDGLRSIDDPHILAAGDAATLANHPETPKSGVYAVREGPVLRDNLARALALARGAPGAARADRRYCPQRRSLVLLNTGDGRAILAYGPLALEGRWVMRLKDRIDRRFMRRFQRLGER